MKREELWKSEDGSANLQLLIDENGNLEFKCTGVVPAVGGYNEDYDAEFDLDLEEQRALFKILMVSTGARDVLEGLMDIPPQGNTSALVSVKAHKWKWFVDMMEKLR